MAKSKSPQPKQTENSQTAVINRKAKRDYEIVDKIEAGIVLSGGEVKSIRAGSINLSESYVRIKNAECFLVDCHINPYAFERQDDIKPTKDRKLLLHKREIERLNAQVKQKGLTLIPLAVYFNAKGRCKLEIGVGKGKKVHDKRQDIKERDAKKYLERALRRT